MVAACRVMSRIGWLKHIHVVQAPHVIGILKLAAQPLYLHCRRVNGKKGLISGYLIDLISFEYADTAASERQLQIPQSRVKGTQYERTVFYRSGYVHGKADDAGAVSSQQAILDVNAPVARIKHLS